MTATAPKSDKNDPLLGLLDTFYGDTARTAQPAPQTTSMLGKAKNAVVGFGMSWFKGLRPNDNAIAIERMSLTARNLTQQAPNFEPEFSVDDIPLDNLYTFIDQQILEAAIHERSIIPQELFEPLSRPDLGGQNGAATPPRANDTTASGLDGQSGATPASAPQSGQDDAAASTEATSSHEFTPNLRERRISSSFLDSRGDDEHSHSVRPRSNSFGAAATDDDAVLERTTDWVHTTRETGSDSRGIEGRTDLRSNQPPTTHANASTSSGNLDGNAGASPGSTGSNPEEPDSADNRPTAAERDVRRRREEALGKLTQHEVNLSWLLTKLNTFQTRVVEINNSIAAKSDAIAGEIQNYESELCAITREMASALTTLFETFGSQTLPFRNDARLLEETSLICNKGSTFVAEKLSPTVETLAGYITLDLNSACEPSLQYLEQQNSRYTYTDKTENTARQCQISAKEIVKHLTSAIQHFQRLKPLNEQPQQGAGEGSPPPPAPAGKDDAPAAAPAPAADSVLPPNTRHGTADTGHQANDTEMRRHSAQTGGARGNAERSVYGDTGIDSHFPPQFELTRGLGSSADRPAQEQRFSHTSVANDDEADAFAHRSQDGEAGSDADRNIRYSEIERVFEFPREFDLNGDWLNGHWDLPSAARNSKSRSRSTSVASRSASKRAPSEARSSQRNSGSYSYTYSDGSHSGSGSSAYSASSSQRSAGPAPVAMRSPDATPLTIVVRTATQTIEVEMQRHKGIPMSKSVSILL